MIEREAAKMVQDPESGDQGKEGKVKNAAAGMCKNLG